MFATKINMSLYCKYSLYKVAIHCNVCIHNAPSMVFAFFSVFCTVLRIMDLYFVLLRLFPLLTAEVAEIEKMALFVGNDNNYVI